MVTAVIFQLPRYDDARFSGQTSPAICIRVPVTGRQPTTHHLDVREADAVFIAEMAVASGSCAIKLAYKNYQSDVGAVIKLMNPYRCLMQ